MNDFDPTLLSDKLHAMLSFKLVRIGRRIELITARIAHSEQLSLNDFKVLLLVSRPQPITLSEAIRTTSIDQGQTSRSVKRLLFLGCIQSVSAADDRRKRYLELTQKGIAVLQRLFPLREKLDQALCAAITSSHQLKELDGVLDKLLALATNEDFSEGFCIALSELKNNKS